MALDLTSRDHDLNTLEFTLWIYIIFEKKILHDFLYILLGNTSSHYCCPHLKFQTLYLNKLDSTVPKDASKQIWNSLFKGFLRWTFLKDCLNIFPCKNASLSFGTTFLRGSIIWTNLNLHYIRMLPNKLELFRYNGFEKEFLKDFLYLFLCKTSSLGGDSWPYFSGLWFEQSWIYTTEGFSHKILRFSGQMIF